MQDRYTGDIGDFGKLGLLRQLTRTGLPIGVNWYLTPDETHNSDGRHTGYLNDPNFGVCDEQLWTELGECVRSGKRQVSELERPEILGASFYSEPLDFRGVDKAERASVRWGWHSRALNRLGNSKIIFVDPDNGLIVPSAQGGTKSNKYVLPMELAEYYRSGASVIYYQHKARLPDEFYILQHNDLVQTGAFHGAVAYGLKFRTTSVRYYFFLIHPEHADMMLPCIKSMLATDWKKHFEEVEL